MKLGKALYYLHNQDLFEGDIYIKVVDWLMHNKSPKYVEAILEFAPQFASPQRGTKQLSDQFRYRYKHDVQLGVLYTAVQFNPQFRFADNGRTARHSTGAVEE